MRTYVREDGVAVIEISDTERRALDALDRTSAELLLSTRADRLGLGSFVPTNTDRDGNPTTGTTWWTGHPARRDDALAQFTVIGEAIEDVTNPRRLAAMKLICDDITAARTAKADDARPVIDKQTLRERLEAARSAVIATPDPPDRPTRDLPTPARINRRSP